MTKGNYNLEEVRFHHIVLEGSHYEIGEQIGEYIKQDKKRLKKYTSKLKPKKFGFDTFESIRIFYESICPGITDELQGIADSLDLSIEKMSYWGTSLCAPTRKNCSQLAVLSSITETGHSYFGRNYDFNTTRDDCVLSTTKAKGKTSHIGFTAYLHGRHDGMNEHGLVASLSGGGVFGQPHSQNGVVIWVAIRAILDSCITVEDALKLLKSIPVGDYDNLLLLDKNKNAAHVEFADGKYSVKQISSKESEGFVYSVNHFLLPETKEFNKLNTVLLSHSKQRSKVIKSTIEGCTPNIRKEDIRKLLSTPHPNGLCNHYYNEGFGTLWSVIYNSTQGEADVCFGAPTHNEYITFNLDDSKGIKEYTAVAPITKERLPI